MAVRTRVTTRALASGLAITALTACGGEASTGIESDGMVARLEVSFGQSTIPIGESTPISVVAYDRANTVVPDVQVQWKSETPTVAIIDEGRVIGLTSGSAQISATTKGIVGTGTLTVSNVDDVAILDARLTQAVQEPDQSIPIVLDGLPAVLNVLLRPRARAVPPTEIVLRLLNSTGAVEYSDTSRYSGAVHDNGLVWPTVQFLIPANKLRFGLKWQVIRDPRGVQPDDSTANDIFPRTVPRPLPTVDVAPLAVHLVPVRLANEGGITGTVTPAMIEGYLRDVRRMMPIGKLDVTIGDVLVSSQTFGIKPKGGDNIFWSRVLSQLDAARMASGEHRSKYWIGIIERPTTYASVEFAGYAYRPSPERGDGVGTRTAAVLSLGSFNTSYARSLIVHELGHTFGRSHTPCGGPALFDIAYPRAGGFIEQVGHDVYSWSAGYTSFAVGIPTTASDVMGYCPDKWSSVYTYRGVLEFRRMASLSATAASISAGDSEPLTRSLVVSGMMDGDSLTMFPVEQRDMPEHRTATPANSGTHRVELLDATGRVLHSERTDLHATGTDGVRTFLLWVPAASLSGEPTSIRIGAPARSYTRTIQHQR